MAMCTDRYDGIGTPYHLIADLPLGLRNGENPSAYEVAQAWQCDDPGVSGNSTWHLNLQSDSTYTCVSHEYSMVQ